MKKNQGITLISLIVTIIVMLIIAGLSIRGLTGDKGLINQAKQTKSAAEIQGLKEQIELAKVKAELKSNKVTMETLIQQLIKDGVITDESQVNKETGDIAFGDSVLEGELADYVMSPGEKYYGDKNIVPTNQKYFSFTVDSKTGTATLTGVKDEYAVKAYKDGEPTKYTAVIKDGNNYIKDVVIPYEMTHTDGKKYTVTAIGHAAFYGVNDASYTNTEEKFTSFALPNTITNIGTSVFYGCSNLSSINIPENVSKIGANAFLKCFGLPNTINLSKVTTLGSGAFQACNSLVNVKLGEGLESIEKSTFIGCSQLKNINIPNTVTTIKSFAFANCSNLEKVKLPDSVVIIEEQVFNGCSSLQEINIPNGVTSIEKGLFLNCSNLRSINLPDSVTIIGKQAFSACTSLSSIRIPEGVTKIDDNAFSVCTSLNDVYIPRNVISMGSQVFNKWTSNQTINCEILESEKPQTWQADWDYYATDIARKATLNWGVSM